MATPQRNLTQSRGRRNIIVIWGGHAARGVQVLLHPREGSEERMEKVSEEFSGDPQIWVDFERQMALFLRG